MVLNPPDSSPTYATATGGCESESSRWSPGRSALAGAHGHGRLPRSRGSAGAEFVVQHDDAAGGVVRAVRAHCLTLGGFPRRTQRRRIVEVRLEHAVIRRLALAGGDVEAVAIAAQAGKLRHQRQVRVLVVASEMVRVRRRRIENEEPVHGANCNRPQTAVAQAHGAPTISRW